MFDVLSKVRNSLLDFMLKIDSEFGNISEIEELKTKKNEISTIMSQTIINNSGDGNILNTGDAAKIDATITITKGNKDELSSHLRETGAEEVDIEELMRVIDQEEPKTDTFSPQVNSWIQKMIGKALEGTWKVGIGAAGGLLASAIKMYYGI